MTICTSHYTKTSIFNLNYVQFSYPLELFLLYVPLVTPAGWKQCSLALSVTISNVETQIPSPRQKGQHA